MNKRFLLALGLWLLLVVAYFVIKINFFPPPPEPEQPKVLAPYIVPDEQGEQLLQPLAMPLTQVDLALHAQPREVEAAVSKVIAERASAAERAVELRKKQESQWQEDAITLGSATGYKLMVRLSRAGAAVRRIQLNEYKSADRATARPTDQPLLLVDDDLDGTLNNLPLAERLERQSYRLLVDDMPLAWEVLPDQERTDENGVLTQVVFQAIAAGKNVRIIKTFTLAPGDYHVGMHLRFESLAPGAEVRYTLTGARGVPVEGEVWKTMPFRQVVTGTVTPSGSAIRHLVTPQEIRDDAKRGEKEKKLKSPPIAGDSPPERLQFSGVMLQFFASLAVVDGDPNKQAYIEKVEPEYYGDDPKPLVHGQEWPINERFQGRIAPKLTSRVIKPATDAPQEHQYLLYSGPTKIYLLRFQSGVSGEVVDSYYSHHLNIMTDYPWWPIFAFGWTQLVVFFTDCMHWLLIHLSWICGGHHWAAIILMTVLVRGLLFPISRRQALMSLRMQKLAPELKALQEKYKDDRQAMAAAQMELYRKHGVNPFGGCLVMLLQMPVLMGLYYALYESVDLRLSGFLWIENLAAPDMLFYLGSWPIMLKDLTHTLTFGYVVINLGPYFNILPIVSTVLLVVQQKLLTPPPADETQAQQQKMMKYMMVIMGYAFYWVASGLCIYFIISGSWGMLERKLIPKVSHEKPEEPPAKAGPGKRRPKDKASTNGAPDGFLGKMKDWLDDFLEQAKKK